MAISGLLMMIAQAAAAPSAGAATAQTAIVVTGAHDPQAEATVAQCRRAGCAPGVDANASLKVANTQFVAGHYEDARRTLHDALARGQTWKQQAPRLIAALYQAQATVAQHQGDMKDAVRADMHSAYALDTWLGPLSPDTLSARIELGNMLARNRQTEEARRTYQSVADRAKASGQTMFGHVAAISLAWLEYRTGYQSIAEARLTALSTLPGDDASLVRIASATLLAQIGRDHNDSRPADRLVEMLAREKTGDTPILLYAAPLPSPDPPTHDEIFAPLQSDRFDGGAHEKDEWVDVGFWIRPGGNVDDVQVLRGSRDTSWAKGALKAVGQRRYSETRADPAGLGTYQVVRLSLGYAMITPSKSLISRRAGPGRISELDLAKSDWPPPPAS